MLISIISQGLIWAILGLDRRFRENFINSFSWTFTSRSHQVLKPASSTLFLQARLNKKPLKRGLLTIASGIPDKGHKLWFGTW